MSGASTPQIDQETARDEVEETSDTPKLLSPGRKHVAKTISILLIGKPALCVGDQPGPVLPAPNKRLNGFFARYSRGRDRRVHCHGYAPSNCVRV
jgi:hypothetical protein